MPVPFFVRLVAAPASVEEIVWVFVLRAVRVVAAARVIVPPERVTDPATVLKLRLRAFTVPTGTVPPPKDPVGPPQLHSSYKDVVKFDKRWEPPVMLLVQTILSEGTHEVVLLIVPKLPPLAGSQYLIPKRVTVKV